MRLEGKVALITGGARGQGAAEARLFVKEGAKVVIGDILDVEGQKMEAEIAETGGECLYVHLDVTSEADWRNGIDRAVSQFGKLDILVNNAGVTRDTLLARMKSADWDLVLDTDLKSVYRMSRACLRPMMKARTGRIISITSIVGATGNAGQANYAAAKAGIEGFTRALALEVASRHITVNSVAPGFIETDMTAALDSTMRSHLLDRIPLGTLGQAADIAGAVAFLASPSANYITGHTLHVNGGMYMH